jgi:hypothetical protein
MQPQVNVTTEYNLVISQCNYIINEVQKANESYSGEPSSNLIQAINIMVRNTQNVDNILTSLLMMVGFINNELSLCMITGCTDEINHNYLSRLINIIHSSRREVIKQAAAQGRFPGQGVN